MKTFLRGISDSRFFGFVSATLLCGFVSSFCLMGCGEDNSSVGTDVSEKNETPEQSETPEQPLDSVKLLEYDRLTGFVEKVYKNAEQVRVITLSELDSGLVFTGREFTEKVDSSTGFFVFKNLKLQSPYVLLNHNGYSLISQMWSFVDLQKNDSVYVNSMTTTEFRRVMNLVKNGLPTDSAEKQAQHEIMKDLFQKTYDIKPSNQIAKNDADSIANTILQLYSQNLSCKKAAYKYESNGTWNVDSLKTKFADRMYFILGYPNSEDYDFLMGRLSAVIFGNIGGLGECSAKNDGEAKRITNERSDFYRQPFVCKKDSGWTYPGARFQDTFEWESGYDGEWRKGDFHNPFKYAYDSLQGEWIPYLGDSVGVACVSSKLDEVRKRTPTNAFDSGYDKCILDDGYFYWVSSATEEDYIKYGTKNLECDSLGRVQKLPIDSTFEVVCEDGKFIKASVAHKNADLIEKEKIANPCGDEDDELRRGTTDTTVYFSCYHGAVKIASDLDKLFGRACNLGSKGYYQYQNSMYYCDAVLWKYTSDSLVTEVVTDTRDDATYKTVGIGSQIWMAENMNLKTDSSWCYQNDEDNCEKYGRLYQWNTNVGVKDKTKNICPEGFRVPSSEDWETLKSFTYSIFERDDYARVLGTKEGWEKRTEWYIGNDNLVGFSAVPSGIRNTKGKYADVFDAAYFCTTDYTDTTFTAYKLAKLQRGFSGIETEKNSACAVRCIKE